MLSRNSKLSRESFPLTDGDSVDHHSIGHLKNAPLQVTELDIAATYRDAGLT